MDLRAYYKKVREAEAQLIGDHTILVSLATPEGGREGVYTEASRAVASKMIAEGRSRVATDAEALQYREQLAAARQLHEESEAANRMKVMVIPSSEFRKRERS